MYAALTRREIEVAGVRLSYVERAAAPGAQRPPMLLLHGLIASGETFAALIAELPGDRHIVALDLPGAGFSERSPTADVSFAGMAQIVREFMAALGLVQPVLLGHSHGGAVSLRLAAGSPELLSRLVLLAPAHPWSGHERAIIAFYLSWFGRQVARVAPFLPAALHAVAFRQMTGPGARLDPVVLDIYRQAGKVPGTVPHLLRLLRGWQESMDELRACLSANPIALPTLVFWGDRDPVVPIATAAVLERRLLHCRHVTLPGIGHLPNEEAPLLCASFITEWLHA